MLRARFEDDPRADSRGADSTLADLPLWRSPVDDVFAIVGDIKIRNDKNPVTALVQALTHVSELVTPNQLRASGAATANLKLVVRGSI